jgi:hypothetical protein
VLTIYDVKSSSWKTLIIAVIILLFLPLTFSTNNINNNNASAQPSQCDPNNPNSDECRHELRVQAYSACLKAIEAWNALGSFQLDPLQQCQHLKPIEPFQGPPLPNTTRCIILVLSITAIIPKLSFGLLPTYINPLAGVCYHRLL